MREPHRREVLYLLIENELGVKVLPSPNDQPLLLQSLQSNSMQTHLRPFYADAFGRIQYVPIEYTAHLVHLFHITHPEYSQKA